MGIYNVCFTILSVQQKGGLGMRLGWESLTQPSMASEAMAYLCYQYCTLFIY